MKQAVGEEIRIWAGGAPGSEAAAQQEVCFAEADGRRVFRNVTVPTLSVFRPQPETAGGTAVVIAPGGGFFMLSWDSEGTEAAEWLCRRGVTCFVLKYRLADTGATEDDFNSYVAGIFMRAGAGQVGREFAASPDSLRATADGVRALQLVRERAAEWDLRPDRIGLLGFSAGAFLGVNVALGEAADSRPDFLAAIYGGAALVPVPPDAPPLFALVAADDRLCHSASLQLYRDWHEAGRPAELHVYARGSHGFGMRRQGLPSDTWIERLGDWMADQGLLR